MPKGDLYVRYNGEFYSWTNATTSNNPTGGPIILGYIYNWTRNAPQHYELTNTFNPGYGYQMYAYYNCSIYYYVAGPLGILPIGDRNNLNKITSYEDKINIHDIDDASQKWEIKLELNEIGGLYDYVFFGERTDSLDTIDYFDVPKNPPGISPYIHVFFEESCIEPYDKLWRSYKQYPSINNYWNLVVQWVSSNQNSQTNITISWDKDSFKNSNYNNIGVYDEENNIKLVDMLINEAYTFTCSAFTIQKFKIICSSNQPPIKPHNPNPYNNANDIKTKLYLSWSGGDPDLGDKVNYDIYFDKTIPPKKVESNQYTNTYNPGILNNNTVYYWRIISRDLLGSETSGPLWSFTTGKSDIQDNISNKISLEYPNQKLLSKNVIFNRIN